jgi:hypothetical protein
MCERLRKGPPSQKPSPKFGAENRRDKRLLYSKPTESLCRRDLGGRIRRTLDLGVTGVGEATSTSG